MAFMTKLAISLLAGFAAAGFVWVAWSIMERVRSRKSAAAPAAEPADGEKTRNQPAKERPSG